MPSPMSGTLMLGTVTARLHRALERRGDARRSREVRPSQRVRIWRVPAGHALDRCFEMVKAMLLHERHELGPEAAAARRLMHDDAAAGLLHGLDHGGQI